MPVSVARESFFYTHKTRLVFSLVIFDHISFLLLAEYRLIFSFIDTNFSYQSSWKLIEKKKKSQLYKKTSDDLHFSPTLCARERSERSCSLAIYQSLLDVSWHIYLYIHLPRRLFFVAWPISARSWPVEAFSRRQR